MSFKKAFNGAKIVERDNPTMKCNTNEYKKLS